MVDWDIHHGNGTQKHFYEDDRFVHRVTLLPVFGERPVRGAI